MKINAQHFFVHYWDTQDLYNPQDDLNDKDKDKDKDNDTTLVIFWIQLSAGIWPFYYPARNI